MSLLEKQTQTTPSIAGTDDERSEMLRGLIAGRLASELGLGLADLRIGLVVAKNLLDRGLTAEAMRVYATLVLCAPTDIDFQVGLANCASALGEHYIALQAASAVVALAPSDPRGYLLSGRSCLNIGSVSEAEQDLDDALDLAQQTGNAVVEREARMLLARLAAARD